MIEDPIEKRKVETKIPWWTGNTKGFTTIETIVEGPTLVAKAISKEIAAWFKHTYGAKVRISEVNPE